MVSPRPQTANQSHKPKSTGYSLHLMSPTISTNLNKHETLSTERQPLISVVNECRQVSNEIDDFEQRLNVLKASPPKPKRKIEQKVKYSLQTRLDQLKY